MEINFYDKLRKALNEQEGDIWTETILTGMYAGKKRLIIANASDGEEIARQQSEKKSREDIMVSEDIFRERIGRTPRLIICGGGHVSIPIIKIGKMIGFSVTVLEDRPLFADHARAAGADTVICEPFAEGLKKIEGSMDCWFVIVTRGHRYDMDCLELILQKKHAYAGMMGSRRRVAIVKDQLEDRGVERDLLEKVHTPIGLKIGACTPEEIAVSIMAEIIQIKNSGNKTGVYSAEILEAVFHNDNLKKVMATIISRKGSAPREKGTKMLIMEDGKTVDTIGGGCIEGEIIRKALLMMKNDTPYFEICKVDMTADAAEDEGMVCGGIVEVMLERVM